MLLACFKVEIGKTENGDRTMISTERMSDQPLLINSCGVDRIQEKTRGSLRPNGRVDYLLLYVHEGSCHVRFAENDPVFEVEEGSVLLFRPHERQEYRFLAGSRSVSYYLHFTGRECDTLLGSLGLSEEHFLPLGKAIHLERMFETILSELAVRKPMYEQVCAAHLMQLLCTVAREYARMRSRVNRVGEERVDRALEIICKDLSVSHSVQELARACCLSEGHFSHVFCDVIGRSPYAHMLFLRMEKAKDLLLSTGMSVGEIGAIVGYTDPNYFSRIFKRQTGHSPSEYRLMR